LESKTKRKIDLRAHPQNRPFIALGEIASSYDLGTSQFLRHFTSSTDWE